MDFQRLRNELQFKAVRSSGKGGQNVNKVATKVELRFDVIASAVLGEEAKELILANLSNRISNEGILRLVSQETRSQSSNKEHIIKRFNKLIKEAMQVTPPRRPTKTPKSVKRKRMNDKRQLSEKKANRKKVKLQKFDLFLFPS